MEYIILFCAIGAIIAGILEGLEKTSKSKKPLKQSCDNTNNWFFFLFFDSNK